MLQQAGVCVAVTDGVLVALAHGNFDALSNVEVPEANRVGTGAASDGMTSGPSSAPNAVRLASLGWDVASPGERVEGNDWYSIPVTMPGAGARTPIARCITAARAVSAQSATPGETDAYVSWWATSSQRYAQEWQERPHALASLATRPDDGGLPRGHCRRPVALGTL